MNILQDIPTRHDLLRFRYPDLENDTGLKPGDIYSIGEILDEIDSVTELYILRAQVTNKSYGISTWVRFTNFKVFFDILIPSSHPNKEIYCKILKDTMRFTNARHPNGSWISMTSLVKDYKRVKRNDGNEYLRILFTDHNKRRAVIQAMRQQKFDSYKICEDSINGKYGQFISHSRLNAKEKEDYFHVSGFFKLKDQTRTLSIDEYQNCIDFEKDIIFLEDEFFCNETVHAFDLETTFLQNFNSEVKEKNMMSRGNTPFDRAYMNVSVYIQGNDPIPLGVICILDVGDDTPLRYEPDEKINERLWNMVNNITKFQKVDPEIVKSRINFFGKSFQEMVNSEHEVINSLIDEMGDPVKFPVYVLKVKGEHDFFRAFAKMQYNICPHILIGHNSNGFDMPFIMRRLEYLGNEMIEEFYHLATEKKMTYGEMFKYKAIRKEKITIAQGEEPVDFIYIKFDGTLFWDSMTIFQRAFSGKLSSLNYMLDTLEIPSKIGISYKRINEIVNLAIESKKLEDEIAMLDMNSIDYCDKFDQLEIRKKNIITDFNGYAGLEKLCTDILEYCFYDSWGVLLSIIKMQTLVSYRLDATIYNCEFAQPFRGGKTSMLNCLIAKEYNKECHDKPVSYGPKNKVTFQGAEVLKPETGYFMAPVVTVDFAGLYPSIMRQYNMGPDTLRYEKPDVKHHVIHLTDENTNTEVDVYFIHEDMQESIIRQILNDLIKKRKEAKKERDKYIDINEIMYNILERKQLAYKMSANAIYGGLGSEYLGIAIPIISQCVTYTARKLIINLKDFIQSYHTGQFCAELQDTENDEISKVIYGDTDSCLALLPKQMLREIMEKYYKHFTNNTLSIETREEYFFKMYDELTKKGSMFGKEICNAYNRYNRDRGIDIITLEYEKLLFDMTLNSKKHYAGYKFELKSDGSPPDYFFSKDFYGAKDHISRKAKLFNKKLVFQEMIDAFMKETDEFQKFSFMKRFQNIHLKGVKSVRRDSNNLTKVFEQMTYSLLFDYKEKLRFIMTKEFNSFDKFFSFFTNSQHDKNNWLKSCLENSIRKVTGFINRKMNSEDLYILEDNVRINSCEINTSSIIEKMKHKLFDSESYNIVKGKLVLYEDKSMGRRHYFPNEINWNEKTSFELVDGDFWYKNMRLKYKGKAERKGNPSVITMVNRLNQEGKEIPSGRVNVVIKYLPGKRSVGERMILSEEYDPEKDTIDTLYYVKKFSSFIESSLNITDKEADIFLLKCYNDVIGLPNKKRKFGDVNESLVYNDPLPESSKDSKQKKGKHKNASVFQSKITNFLA